MTETRKPIPFVDLARQHADIEADVMAAIRGVATEAAFIRGPALGAFENSFAALHDARHGIGVNSGTDALALAVRALGIGPGDEVVTVPNTWISTAFAVSHAGATPVFCDIDPDTYQMDPAALERVITPRTKAVIPVHMFGHPAPMTAIEKICRARGISIIEDVAQAPLTRVDGRLVGTIGDIGCFSFYPSKNLGGYGDGGMALTSDDALAARLRQLSNYGQNEPHRHQEIGFNSRLDTLQAAILLAKLPYLESWTAARRKAAALYDERLADLPVKRPVAAPGAEPVYHLYVIEVENRDACLAYLRDNAVMAQVHYHGVIHLQECYGDLGYRPGDFPVAERAQEHILSLPIYPQITERQIDQVVGTLAEFTSGKAR
ncbi:MAG: DegT/DnrJ/EryC1/StrS family aminotransferase [Proteobacteria bacterium]|nr:DegT/DnrJ/EryC1/StrS family aminotransferase [Pseudomonadota bacterium]